VISVNTPSPLLLFRFPPLCFSMTLYNKSFKCIYMSLRSLLQVTATDRSTTIMSWLNAFIPLYTHKLHNYHIANAPTLPRMDQRSPPQMNTFVRYCNRHGSLAGTKACSWWYLITERKTHNVHIVILTHRTVSVIQVRFLQYIAWYISQASAHSSHAQPSSGEW
jgi:hypothetical protein